jgi:hypothetical protein
MRLFCVSVLGIARKRRNRLSRTDTKLAKLMASAPWMPTAFPYCGKAFGKKNARMNSAPETEFGYEEVGVPWSSRDLQNSVVLTRYDENKVVNRRIRDFAQ